MNTVEAKSLDDLIANFEVHMLKQKVQIISEVFYTFLIFYNFILQKNFV